MKKNNATDCLMKRVIFIIIGLSLAFSIVVLASEKFGYSFDWLLKKEKPTEEINIIQEDTVWSYMDGGKEPGVGNVWTTLRYDASAWGQRTGSFAAEKAGAEEDAPTYFFRKEFQLEDKASIASIEGEISYSDAVIVYLNGKIVFAGNVPDGGYRSNQETGVAEETDKIRNDKFVITDLSALEEGKNVLAVEIHQKDRQKQEAYFQFHKFNLTGIEQETIAPDTAGIMLEQGSAEDEVCVNWLSDASGSYVVEYAPAAEYGKGGRKFSAIANTVLMGKRETEKGKQWNNRGTLTHLKTNTEYIYRVREIGSKKGSEFLRFATAGKPNFTFAVMGGSGDYSAAAWKTAVQRGTDLAGKTDFILSAGNDITDQVQLRSPLVFKEIPVCQVGGSEEPGDQSFTYQDAVVIALDSREKDVEVHRAFLKNAIREAQRKWVIVAMYDATADGEYRKLFDEMEVDLVFGGDGTQYSNAYASDKGKTLYVSPGPLVAGGGEKSVPSIVKVDVGDKALQITAYNLNTGKEIEKTKVYKEAQDK